MAYDFGTNTLGIKNPFKLEGIAKTVTGIAICILGIMPLLSVADDLKTDMIKAWVHAGIGLFMLIWGFRHMGVGIFQLFKYFVGRSVPTSLAYNHNISEKDNAEYEKDYTVYSENEIESMLVGRKNSTFIEPIGWLARMIHSIVPKLVFTPYPIRNFVQELGGLVTSSIIGFVAFSISYFISVSGMAGDAGVFITPVLSVLLLVYLVIMLRSTANSLTFSNNRNLHSKDSSSLAKLIAFSILVPVIVGFTYSKADTGIRESVSIIFQNLNLFDAWFNLGLLLIVSFIAIAISSVMIRERLSLAKPDTEVCEYRDNIQESVHPSEIFINIENIVLANRRYKEIPNRIYQAFDPVLNEQSQGKGSFKGQLLIETQPEFKEIEYSKIFKTFRITSTVVSQTLTFISAVLFTYFIMSFYEVYNFVDIKLHTIKSLTDAQKMEEFTAFGALIASALTLLFSWLTISAVANILARGTRLFWAEMQFSSLILWLKTEGTYTESKISTGMSIHDSTRSENVVVRSSITPWIISSRIMTSTFATVGVQNIEMPRYIMKMTKNDDELNAIVGEIKSFLMNREAIASIRNEKDLNNAEVIFQVNQTSRAHMIQPGHESDQVKLEEQQAAGKIRNESTNDDNKL